MSDVMNAPRAEEESTDEMEEQPFSKPRSDVRESADTDGRAAVAIVALTLAFIIFLILRIL